MPAIGQGDTGSLTDWLIVHRPRFDRGRGPLSEVAEGAFLRVGLLACEPRNFSVAGVAITPRHDGSKGSDRQENSPLHHAVGCQKHPVDSSE